MSETEYENETESEADAKFETESVYEKPVSLLNQSTGDISAIGDIKCYKRALKRQDDGLQLCHDLMTLTQERAEIEKNYAKLLKAWAKKWEEAINKGPQYGTTKAAWKAVMTAADREADVHFDTRDDLVNNVIASVKQWTFKHFHKPRVGPIKETKELEDEFKRAQKPWAQREAKVAEAKKKYHAACKQEQSAALQESNASKDNTTSPEQLKKIQEKADKAKTEVETTKESYEAALKYLEAYNARYTEDMAEVFQRSQQLEEKRLRFFKEKLMALYKCLNLSRDQMSVAQANKMMEIYDQCYVTLTKAEADLDLKWWAENNGMNTGMSWPSFEEYSHDAQQPRISYNNNATEQHPDREYDKRLVLYRDRVWTCQCTGQIHLTHKEAMESERKVHQMLDENFPEVFYKPVLEVVHHSTDVLDALTDQAWRKIHEKLIVGEKVSLKINNCEKSIEGSIVAVDASSQQDGSGSPSSNKENTSDEEKTDTSPRKFSPPKLLPHKYSFKMANEDKVISSVPSHDLVRTQRPPSKESVKMFIRANAVRGGYNFNSPWVVDEKLVVKYHLPSKYADFFVSASKMMELGRKALEEATKNKRRLSSSQGPPNKRAKTRAQSPKKTGRKSDSNTTVNGKTPSVECVSSDSDDEPLTHLQRRRSEDSEDEALSSLRTPSKKCSTIELSSDDEPLVKCTSPNKKRGRPKKTEGTPKKGSQTPKKRDQTPKKKDQTPKKSGQSTKKSNQTPKKKKSAEDSEDESLAALSRREGSKKKKASSNDKMKQMTLFDMKKPRGRPPGSPNKKTPQKTPHKSPLKSPQKSSPKKQPSSPKKAAYRLPASAARLKRAMTLDKGKQTINKLVTQCATVLQLSQIQQLPDELRDTVLKRHNTIEERKKVKNMSGEELERYKALKKEEMRRKLRLMMRKKWADMSRRFEDTELDLEPLPTPSLVPTPDGLSNALFGDVVMVTEFIACFRGLLMPDDKTPISPERLMRSLVSNEAGFSYLAHVLTVLLQTLLQDEIAEDYRELSVCLRDIAVKTHTVSELVRLSLRKRDVPPDPLSDDEGAAEDEVPEELIDRLEREELCRLPAEDKLLLVQGLCHRIMGSYSVQDYMEDKQNKASELWRQRIASQKEAKKHKTKKRGQRANHMTEKPTDKPTEDAEKKQDKGMTITDFYGQSSATEERDLASVVKRRRLLAAQAVEERQRRETSLRSHHQKQAEAYKQEREREAKERQFNEGVLLSRLVLRQSPIGSDRDHSRYWVFQQQTDSPTLYVEKGWAPEHINYTLRDADEVTSCSSYDEDDEPDSEKSRRRRRRKRQEMAEEKTVPSVGQNAWFHFTSASDLELLYKNLHPLGARESALKTELNKHLPALTHAINARTDDDDVKEEDEELGMREAFTEECIELELRLRNGGLGGVPDFIPWETRARKATTITDLGECLIETQAYIPAKFLKGIMVKKVKKSKVKVETEEGETNEEEMKVEEVEEAAGSVWVAAVRACPTFSRLHVMMSILDSCVKWEKSAENEKCKICRRRSDDSLLLCDGCNHAYHLYCLRPALFVVPHGDWLCPVCKPRSRRMTRVNHDYARMAEVGTDNTEASSGAEESLNQETECAVCGGDEGLVNCSSCPSAFHLDCHDPPLRHPPRSSAWQCMQCKTGVKIRKTRRWRSYKETEEEEEEVKPRRTTRKTKPKWSCHRDSDGDDDVDVEVPCDKSRKTRNSGGLGVTDHMTDHVTENVTKSVTGRTRGRKPRVTTELSRPERERKAMAEILSRLRRFRHSWPFNEPVDPKLVPDYYSIVKSPMDLQTVEDRLVSDVYSDPTPFITDIAAIFTNCELYNKSDSAVGRCVAPVEKLFTDLLQRHLPSHHNPRQPPPASNTTTDDDDDDDDESSDDGDSSDSNDDDDDDSNNDDSDNDEGDDDSDDESSDSDSSDSSDQTDATSASQLS